MVRRVAQLDGARALEGSPAPWGFYRVKGELLEAHIPDDKWAAESVLRIAWQISTFRQGGVLMHGCGFAWGDRGFAAIGHSTAGKSTLARLSCGPPGDATLLTDEIVQLFPDGRLFGTPFRSDTETPGTPGDVRLESLLLLTKGVHEQLDVVPATTAIPELLGQLYRGTSEEMSPAEAVRRVLALVDRVGVQRLTFRKDPVVGAFLQRSLKR
ncbi:MAG: hypothetical protein JNK82_26180 [Myxococcaceae bacterium]|nr:hypothetical protein [Myxococcaceae bacterium]